MSADRYVPLQVIAGEQPSPIQLSFQQGPLLIRGLSVVNSSALTISIFLQKQVSNTPDFTILPFQILSVPIPQSQYIWCSFNGPASGNGYIYFHFSTDAVTSLTSQATAPASNLGIIFGNGTQIEFTTGNAGEAQRAPTSSFEGENANIGQGVYIDSMTVTGAPDTFDYSFGIQINFDVPPVFPAMLHRVFGDLTPGFSWHVANNTNAAWNVTGLLFIAESTFSAPIKLNVAWVGHIE